MSLNQPQRQWVSCAGILTIAAIATAGITPPGFTQAAPRLAQAGTSLIGQCRAVNKQTPIFEQRSTASKALVLLKPNEQVTLAENGGQGGLIAVSKPTPGYVISANLKGCTPAPTPTPTPTPAPGGTCRLVTPPEGLVVRKDPTTQGAVMGSVFVNQKVTLVSPVQRQTNPDGRIWVKISAPVAGWVSEGMTGGGSNLGACP